MSKIAFFILNIIISTQLFVAAAYFILYEYDDLFFSSKMVTDICLIRGIFYWIMLIAAKIYIFIFLYKITDPEIPLGKFFAKLKTEKRFRKIILSLAILLDLFLYGIVTLVSSHSFIRILIDPLIMGTGVTLSYISLFIWFEKHKEQEVNT